MADRRTILVSGATGQQGGAIARELLAKGYTIKAMTRKPESAPAKDLARRGAQIVEADLDDPASVERALQGVWGAYAVQNTWEAGVEKEEQQGKRFAELAKKAGVQHLVYSSVGSAHRKTGIPHFENKWRVEETIRGLKFPSYVILRPAFFMENLLGPWFKPAIDQGALMVALDPATVLQMIAVEDIGKYGLVAFERAEELNGEGLDIAGDALTMPETAELISRAAGRTVTFKQLPIEEVRKGSLDFALMLEWFDKVGYNADIPWNAKKFNIKPTTFSEWAGKKKW